MKIIIKTKTGTAKIDENFDIENAIELIGKEELILDVLGKNVQANKLIYLYFELLKDKDLTVSPDKELKDAIDSVDEIDEESEEGLVY